MILFDFPKNRSSVCSESETGVFTQAAGVLNSISHSGSKGVLRLTWFYNQSAVGKDPIGVEMIPYDTEDPTFLQLLVDANGNAGLASANYVIGLDQYSGATLVA